MAPPESLYHRVSSELDTDISKDEFRANDLSLVRTPEGRAKFEKLYTPPDFTIKELRDSIPSHLFERNGYISTLYLLFDLIVCSCLFYVATYFGDLDLPVQLITWPIYWFIQGAFMFGIWVIAHECGHQAYSCSKLLNNTMGMILHSALLVPYHSWRISHAQHHANTGHMTEDHAFIPFKRKDYFSGKTASVMDEAIEASPIINILKIANMLIIGFPAYLTLNTWGKSYPKFASHFHPTSPIFRPTQANLIILSDFGIFVVLCLIGYFINLTSFWTVAKYYIIPYFVCNAWLVLVTYLQHTDVYIPHYNSNSWNFVRGALTTVDRDFGWFLNRALNHITDSHVAHHLFSQMPFYNAIKATPYLQKKLGQYYLKDSTPILRSIYNIFSQCNYVDDEGEVLFYRK